MNDYLIATHKLYEEAARTPNEGLCCTTSPMGQLPGLSIPLKMQKMNYGCGTTVHPRDLADQPNILYVGVGGGMELLQFAWYSRKINGVIGVDTVDGMIAACRENLKEAEHQNTWFQSEFVDVRHGDALGLPVEDESIDVAAQNCLFNIFREDDLKKALAEMYRVLRPHGRLVLSDPVCEVEMPENLKSDDRLRALCLSGAIPLQSYLKLLADTGFGTIEVRAKRPYRILDPENFATEQLIYIESVEVAAIKDPMPADGSCIFTGKTAILFGKEKDFDDGNGHYLLINQPLAVCDKTAGHLAELNRDDIYISESTWHYDGGGCC